MAQMRFYRNVLQEYGAPKLELLTECNAPEVPEWKKHYLANVILNSIFLGVEFPHGAERYILNFLRRMETAVEEYRTGRELLQGYIAELPRRNNHFLQALRSLSHFEQSAAALYQAALLTKPITGENLFEPKDGSPMDRLNLIYNRSKHFNERAGGEAPPAVPVWLTNEGLECSEAVLTFAEMHETILDLTKCATFVAEELPQLIAEKRKAAKEAAGPTQSAPDAKD